MRLSIFLVNFWLFTTVLGKECDDLGISLYEDLGCTPHYESNNPCPTKYTCSNLQPPSGQCTFRGKLYNEQESVDNKLTASSCIFGCTCAEEFVCAIADCFVRPVSPGCHIGYSSLDSCCPDGEVCPLPNTTATCVVDGIEYKEGQRFNVQNSCQRCICHNGETTCQRISCYVQLWRSEFVQNFCAPVYYNDSTKLCCPNFWTCPSGDEIIVGEPTRCDPCTYGNTTLFVGQKFAKEESGTKFICECAVPPLLTCRTIFISDQ